MKSVCLSFLVLITLYPTSATGLLDLEQEKLHIPDTHETASYRANILDNPDDFVAVSQFRAKEKPGGVQQVSFAVSSTLNNPLDELHIFITDRKARSFFHLRPEPHASGGYVAEFRPRYPGRHRVEIVAVYAWGGARFSRNLDVGEMPASDPSPSPDEDYAVRLKTFPAEIYADHVATFVYEITHDGLPVTDLEPIDGNDMVLASWNLGWFSSFEEFVFARSRQNLGGPEAGVSLVFEKPGRHVVFAQFKHRGEIRTIDAQINVRLERKPGHDPFNDGTDF